MFELHFADSELLAPQWDGDTLVLVFAAALVQPQAPVAGAPDDGLGVGAGLGTGSAPVQGHFRSQVRGHVRGLTLRLASARVAGETTAAVGRLADGRWQPEGLMPRRTMVVPQAVDQPVRLSLALANGTALDIRADALQALFSGAPGYRDSLAC